MSRPTRRVERYAVASYFSKIDTVRSPGSIFKINVRSYYQTSTRYAMHSTAACSSTAYRPPVRPLLSGDPTTERERRKKPVGDGKGGAPQSILQWSSSSFAQSHSGTGVGFPARQSRSALISTRRWRMGWLGIPSRLIGGLSLAGEIREQDPLENGTRPEKRPMSGARLWAVNNCQKVVDYLTSKEQQG
jgi:hypothetical protein